MCALYMLLTLSLKVPLEMNITGQAFGLEVKMPVKKPVSLIKVPTCEFCSQSLLMWIMGSSSDVSSN